jgi:hypothetical protein
MESELNGHSERVATENIFIRQEIPQDNGDNFQTLEYHYNNHNNDQIGELVINLHIDIINNIHQVEKVKRSFLVFVALDIYQHLVRPVYNEFKHVCDDIFCYLRQLFSSFKIKTKSTNI